MSTDREQETKQDDLQEAFLQRLLSLVYLLPFVSLSSLLLDTGTPLLEFLQIL